MKTKAFFCRVGLLVCALFALSPNAVEAQSYNIKDLGGLLGTNSYAYGINNQGQVVGYWSDTNGARAFLYSGGAVTDLGSLGGTNRYALSINSSGQIVGFAAATNGIRAFLYSNGSLTNLGAMGGLNSYAYGINDSGQIVGYLDTTNGPRGYLYGGSGVTNLGTLGGTNSYAFGVNNSNLVVGSSLTVSADTHAFLWQNGGLTNLNSLLATNSGWVLNDARGINNSGRIVGWGLTNGQEQAFLYTAGQITKVGMLSGATNSFAFGINNSNQVVGASTLSNSTSRAFVWLNGTLTDLNTLLPAGFDWDLREARGINDNGQIVGWGVTNGQEHAFILSPNTAPSVSLTNPINNAVFAQPATITLGASASDSDGSIAKVEFYQGTIKLGEATTNPYQVTWSSVSSGTYALTVRAIDNSGATNVSAVVNITVAIAPAISSQPQSQRILTSSNVTFSVTASGATPLAYQWQFNGVNIAGATATNYSIANVQTVQGGKYSVVVTNIAGTVSSSSAVLTVTVDPKNIGKGDWIYFLSDATNRLGQNVTNVTDIASLMNYERLQGMQFVVVKCGDGATYWNQFDSNLLAQAHSAGLKIFGYGRVYGTNVPGEIGVATNALALGADGFVIDAEIEYESQNLTNNNSAAAQYCQGIRSACPNAFLAHSPFVYISSHSTFPYVAFGTNCDVVMPQCYWKSFGITASNMVSVLNTEWKNWQNSLTGANTNAIKPIAPIGQGWSVSATNTTTGIEIADFINRLKTASAPATAGGYKGVSFWRADLHAPDMWDRIASSTIGNPTGAPLITMQPQSQMVTNGLTASFTIQASGVAPLNYQWKLNGISLSGATLTDYTITNIQSANVGVYSVIVSNASGVVLSSDAILSIPSCVLWTETFESGLTNWTTVSGASPLTNSSAQNHTVGGTNSAYMGSTLNKMYRNTGVEIAGNAKVMFWIYDSGNSALRALGEVRSYTGNGYGSGAIQQIFAVGVYRVAFGTGTGSLAGEAYDSNKYQGRVYGGSNTGFFNLNGTNAPNRSVGWHRFEIERLSDETTINFYVDGILGRTITNTTAATWDSLAIGSVGTVSSAGDAWFDDVKIEYFGTPGIITQPLDKTVNAGTNVTFSVTASGSISGYQWRFNGANISGATSTSFTLGNVQSANVGGYTVVIQNGVGATVSVTATLALLYPPTVATSPSNQTGNAGAAVTFLVVPGGSGPFTYQWKKNGIALTNSSSVLNATTDQLTITNLSLLDEAAYSVTISNFAGSVNSSSALLTVNAGVIFSDNFEGGLSYWSTVPSASSLSLSSSWANPVSGSQTASQTNSLNKMYHDLGTEVSGRSRATFWIYNASTNITARSFGEVRGFAGGGLNSGALQQIFAIGDYTVPFDQNTGTLTNETVTGYYYQARVFSGANSGWFNLNSPGAPSWTAGWHKFSIEKSADSTVAHFFVDGIYGRTINDVTSATWDVVEIGSAGIGSGVDDEAWFDDVKVEALTNVITSQPSSLIIGAGTAATFTVGATGTNLKYQWRKNGTTIAGASLSTFSITNAQTSNEAFYSVLVTTATDREYSALARLTVVSAPVITLQPNSQTIGSGTNAAFTVSASGVGISYQWKKNSTNLVNGGNITGATNASLAINGVSQVDSAAYAVLVSNLGGSVTSSSAPLTVIDRPVITAQPISQTVVAGVNVLFSVTAGGTAPFSYQWRKNGTNVANGGNVSGATTATLNLTAVLATQVGGYTVVITNLAGSVTSSNATLTMIDPPTITIQPVSQFACDGVALTLSVTASGTGLTYRWQKGGLALSDLETRSGTGTAILQITNVTGSDAGQYSVLITNAGGSILSSVATVTVSAPFFVDLDIDSLNTNGLTRPRRTAAEEAIEADTAQPGKYIIVNDGDADSDGIPDFADGLDRLGNQGTNASAPFVPLVLHLAPSDFPMTRIKFSYSASDPASLTNIWDDSDAHIYIPPGNMRIWTKDGPLSRSVATIASGGDFVASEVAYSLSDFGFSHFNPVITLYIEGIAPSPAAGETISVEVDPDGDGPECSKSDVVRVSVDFDSDRDGLVDRWENQLGTDPHLMDSDNDGRSDLEEIADGTVPTLDGSVKQQRIGFWPFNKAVIGGFVFLTNSQEGAISTYESGVEDLFTPSWEGRAASLRLPRDDAPEEMGLAYDLFRSPIRPNLTPHRGTVSLWFQPNWNSGESILTSPAQNQYSLLSVCQRGTNEYAQLPGAYWGIDFNQTGTNISFCTARASGNTNLTKLLSGAIDWRMATNDFRPGWHQVALSYSETNLALYVDGQILGATNLNELAVWPGTLVSTNPWRIWFGGRSGIDMANGSFDDVETFNYPLTGEEIAAKYHLVADLDSDNDGLSDLEELRRGLDPKNADTDGDGMPDGWEIKYGLNPRDPGDALGNSDRDSRMNRDEFLYGSNPSISNLVSEPLGYDIVGNSSDKSVLVNIDFGNPNKITIQQGPAAAGIDANDQWMLWPINGARYSLPDASGTNTQVRMFCEYGPLYTSYFGCDNVEDGSSGQLCEPFHFLNCTCDKLCQMNIAWLLPPAQSPVTPTMAPAGNILQSPSFEHEYPSPGWPDHPQFPPPTKTFPIPPPQPWPPTTCNESLGCTDTNLCAVLYKYNHMIRQETESGSTPSEPMPEFFKSFWAFDKVFPSTASSNVMFEDFATSYLDSLVEGQQGGDANCSWTVESDHARAMIRIAGLSKKNYRVYLYGGPQSDTNHESIVRVSGGSKFDTNFFGTPGKYGPEIRVPSGDLTSGGYVEGLNYARFLVQPISDEINVKWKYKNSSIRGLQLLELRPLTNPVAQADALLITGPMIQWAPVPQALRYNILRKGPGEAAFRSIATTPFPHFQDFSVLPGPNSDSSNYPRQYSYIVQATNEVYQSLSDPVSVTIQWTPFGGGSASNPGGVNVTNNHPPVLNCIDPLSQAYERTPFAFGAAKIQAAANAFDYEGAPLQFVVTRIVSGKLTWIESTNGVEHLDELTNDSIQEELNSHSRIRIISPNVKVRWTPPDGAKDDTVALRVRAFDGVSLSADFADVKINVKPQTMLLWWGNYGYGLSGGGGPSLVPLQNGVREWSGDRVGAFTSPYTTPDYVGYDENYYSKLPSPVIVSSTSAAELQSIPSLPIVDGTLRNVVALAGSSRVAGPLGSRMALTSDGSVWMWGINRFGQAGDGVTNSPDTTNPRMLSWCAPREQPFVTRVDSISNVVSIAGDGYYSLAVKDDGTVWGWGPSKILYGEGTWVNEFLYMFASPLPRGSVSFYSSVTYNAQDWKAGAAGQISPAMAATYSGSDFALYSGANQPVQIPGLQNIIQVAGSDFYSVALSADGKVYIWGFWDNYWHVSDKPIPIDIDERVVQVAAGDYRFLALTASGNVYSYEPGVLMYKNDFAATLIPNLGRVKQIAACRHNYLMLLENGRVVQDGLMGPAVNTAPSIYKFWPCLPSQYDEVRSLESIVSISAGWESSYAVDADGRLWGWGVDSYGLFGQDYQTDWATHYDWKMYKIPRRASMDPIQLGTVKDVEVAATFDMNGYATASIRDVPQNLEARPNDKSVSLAWDTFGLASQYEVRRALNTDTNYALVATVAGKPGFERQSYIDQDVVNFQKYYYRIAVIVNGHERLSDPVRATPQPAPATPTNLVAVAKSRQIRLKWPAQVNVDDYRIWRSVGGPSAEFRPMITLMNQVKVVDRERYIDDSFLSTGQTNWYKLQAINEVGESDLSEAVSAVTIDGGPAAPDDVSATPFDTSVLLSWSAVASTSSNVFYAVWKAKASCDANNILSTNSALRWELVDVTAHTSFEVEKLVKNRCYAFAVSTVDDAGEGGRSVVVTVRPGGASNPWLTMLEQVAGPGSIYLKWQCDVEMFNVSMKKGTTSYPLCGASTTVVFPGNSGVAEMWVTDLPTGSYNFTIVPIGDGASAEFTYSVDVTNSAPARDVGYPLRPLAATYASNRVELSWWGTTDAEATSALQQFSDWRFIVLKQEAGVQSDGFPCDNFIPAADGKGLSFSDKDARNGHTYKYRLVGINPSLEVYQRNLGDSTTETNDDVISPESFFSTQASVNLSAVALNAAVQLTWSSNNWTLPGDNKVKVELYSARGITEPYYLLANVTSNQMYLHDRLQNDDAYYYKIRAIHQNGDFIEASVVATPSADKPLVAPQNFTGTVGVGRLVVKWQDIAGALAYKVRKWNPTTSLYEPLPTVVTPQFIDALGGSNAIYRYKLCALSSQDGLPTEIAVQPLTWSMPTNSVASFNVQRRCSAGGDWKTIGNTTYLQYVDVRTECIEQAASYRVVPIIGGAEAPTLAQDTIQIKGDDAFLKLPPQSVNVFVQGTNENQQGEIVIRLLDFESATNEESAVGFITPTNVMLRASVSFAPLDLSVKLDRVEFYAEGELLTVASQLPFEYTWKNPAGAISGRIHKLRVRVVDSLGRSEDSPIYFANVTNQPPLKAFTTSANDLQVSAPGIPLTLSRSYNSQDLSLGLLGKGWKTPWDQARVSVPNLADGWYSKRAILAAHPFDIQETNAHRVDVILSGGATEHFHLMPSYDGDRASALGVAGITVGWSNPDSDSFDYRLPFVFAPEGDAFGTLQEKQGATILEVDADDALLVLVGNPEINVRMKRASGDRFAPDSFLYTGSDGSIYEFGQALTVGTNGVQELSLLAISDRNANTVTYKSTSNTTNNTRTFSGISHSSGRSLLWTNQVMSGTQYVCVYDPIGLTNSGAPVVRYLVQNDLLKEVQHLKSRSGSPAYDITKYEYFEGLTNTATAINGMLKRVISPEGTILLENDYFGTASGDPVAYLGFLKSQKDVVGVNASLDHEEDVTSGDITSTVSQSVPGTTSTNSSQAIYDSSGKPVEVRDESGQTNSMGYDDRGRLAFTQNAAGDYKAFDYDAKDRPVAVTDELGHQTEIKYGAFDQPAETTDAAGSPTQYEYYHYTYGHTTNDLNPEGSLWYVIDPADIKTEYTYDKHGQVLSETRTGPGIAAPSTTTNEYYASGDLKVVKEPLWPGGTSKLYTTEYTYDENGNRKTETRYRMVVARDEEGYSSGTNVQEVVTTTYNYDAQGRLLTNVVSVQTGSGSDQSLQSTSSEYNSAGKVAITWDAYGRKTEMLYDVRGNLIETKYVDDAVTRTVYDGRGRALWQQERCLPNGMATTAPATFTEYDVAGRVTAVKRYASVTLQKTMATPKTEEQTIDNSQIQYRRSATLTSPPDQYTIITNAVDMAAFISISRTSYDGLGRVQYSMDTRGNVTGYHYDAVGRRTNVVVYTSYTVSPLTSIIAPTSTHTDTVYGYDENGNQVWVKDALGNQTDFEYDSMNRRTVTRFPEVEGDEGLRRYRKTVYDPLGRRSKEYDEAGVVTAFGYDALGRLTAVTNDFKANYLATETPIATTYGYDEFGNEISQRDAEGHTTLFEYDALGRRTHRFLPGALTDDRPDNAYLERVTYSQVQVQTSPAIYALRKQVKDFRGRITTFGYDILDRLTNSTPSDTNTANTAIATAERTTVDYTYTTSGQRAKIEQSVGTARIVRYAYDGLGRLRVKESPEGTLTYDYDAAGTVSRISARYSYSGWETNASYSFESLAVSATNSARAEWNYRYDSFGRLLKVNPDSTNAVASADATYSYTDVGNLNTTTYRNSLVTTYSYNKRNWLRNLETKNGSGTRVAFFDYDSAGTAGWPALLRLSPTGQRRCVQETYGVAGRTVTYAYDRLSRLTTETIVTNSTGPTGTVHYDKSTGSATTEGYDRVGNRLSRRLIDDQGLALAGVTETTHTFDPHDLITGGEYTYDSAGNTTVDTTSATYVYDAENKLIKRTGVTNAITLVVLPEVNIVYDADGNRVSKSVVVNGETNTTGYLVEDRNPTGYAQVMEEWAFTNAQPAAINRTYVYGLGLISQKQSGNVTYYGYDGLGSTRYLSDSSTNITETYTYDAFGIQIASTGTTLNNYRYTGEQYDPDLGMYYLRTRYYKPELGRFWTMDSFAGNNEDSLSLHKYLYCHADPIGFKDPSGLSSEGVCERISVAALQITMFTIRWAARNPKSAFIFLSALSATGIFDGFPPGELMPIDELQAYGKFLRQAPALTREEYQIAGRYIGALQKTFLNNSHAVSYEKTFFKAFSWLQGKVWVHHAIEQQVLDKYPGVVTREEMNSLANLRGIPNAINAELHLKKIRIWWDEFYKQHPLSCSKQELLDCAKKIDDAVGDQFMPNIR